MLNWFQLVWVYPHISHDDYQDTLSMCLPHTKHYYIGFVQKICSERGSQ